VKIFWFGIGCAVWWALARCRSWRFGAGFGVIGVFRAKVTVLGLSLGLNAAYSESAGYPRDFLKGA
jgi:hypothetical protein